MLLSDKCPVHFLNPAGLFALETLSDSAINGLSDERAFPLTSVNLKKNN